MTDTTLYERLGGLDGITAIAKDIVARHIANPIIGKRFLDTDPAELTQHVIGFFSSGTGGPDIYEGRDMKSAHRGMNLTERELCAAIDDLLAALDGQGIEVATKNEVLGIFYSFKPEVLYQ